MFCPSCGTQLNDGAKFCTNCGTEIKNQPARSPGGPNIVDEQYQSVSPTPQPTPQPVATKERKSNSKKGKTGGIVLLVIGVLSLIGSVANGTINAGTAAVSLGCIAGGAYLLFKNNNQ